MKAILTTLALVGLLAVLAAILFPVFAQSKQSAKSSSLAFRVRSLERQLAMANDSTITTSEPGQGAPQLMTASLETAPRAVVRNATVQMRVDSIDQTERKLQSLVASVHGYMDSEEGTDLSSEEPQLTIKLRVPQETFDGTLAQIEQLGVPRAKSVSSEDVTEKIVDMDARLKTMLAQEETYRGILKSQSGVRGVLDVQDRLMKLREEIESVTAQRKSLAGLASLSTIEVTLVQKADIAAAAASDPNWLAQGWSQAWSAGIAAFRGLTVAVIWLLVFSPGWLAAILLVRFARRPARVPVARIDA